MLSSVVSWSELCVRRRMQELVVQQNKERRQFALRSSSESFSTRHRWLFRLRLVLRGCWLAVVWTPSLLLAPLAYFVPSLRSLHVWLLRQAFVASGPVAIKLAQWAASRPDLISQEVAQSLQMLHDQVPVYHNRSSIVNAALGFLFCGSVLTNASVLSVCSGVALFGNLISGSLFAGHPTESLSDLVVDESALLGAGSVATVHRGLYKGQPVAVKVLRPGVRPVIETDLALLGFLSSAVAFVVPSVKYFDFDTALNQFSAEVRSQLDLQVEAMHLSTFAKMFAGDAEIRVPMPIASTRDVLVMPEVQGIPLSKWIDLENDSKLKKKIANLGMRAFFKMLSRNYVHGDLHAGNIMVQDETVTFLDAGIVIELSPRQSSNFWSLFRVLVNRDANAAANLLLDRGGRCANTNESQFRLDIGKAFSQLPSTFSALESENRSLAGALMQVLNSARNNRVLLDSSFVSLITSCVVLEGTGLRLDPSISLFDMAKEMAKSQLT